MKPAETKPFKTILATLSGTILLTVLVFGIYGYFFFLLNQTRQSVVSLTNEISSMESDEAESNQIQKQLSDTDAQHTILISYFVDVNNPIPFEEAIEGYGKETNTKVVFQQLQVGTGPNKLNTSFAVEGTFANTYKFLTLLESAPYELSVNNLSFQSIGPVNLSTSTKISPVANMWNTQISLSVYSVSGIK